MGQLRAIEYLTTGEAARRLGMSKPTLRRAMRGGAIVPASHTPGGYMRFRAADVEAYARFVATAWSALDRARTPGAQGGGVARHADTGGGTADGGG